MDRHFAWQAWPLWHWAGSGGALGSQLTSLSPRLLAWQAWQACHLATWTVSLRGRRGTWRHWSSLCVAGVKLIALGWFLLRAWLPFDAVVVAAVGVAGVALGDIDLHFAWQAWHLVTSTLQVNHLSQIRLCHTHTTLSRIIFHTRLSHMQLRPHIFATRNFATHTHNFVAHSSFTHNFVTNNFVTHNFVTHNSFTHTTLSQTNLSHTTLSHTTLSQTIFHNYLFTLAQLFVTYNFLSYTIFHTHLCHRQLFHTHTTLSQAIFHTTLHIQLLKLLILHHLHCPFCFFRAASATFSDYWMKLTCGIIRPFNYQYRSTLSHFLWPTLASNIWFLSCTFFDLFSELFLFCL